MNNYSEVGLVMENLKGRSFLTLKDYTTEEIQYLIDLATSLKAKKKAGVYEYNMRGKNIALIFEKPSTRTRCAFTVACNDEGAHPEYLGKNDIQLGHKESVEDTARVLGRMFDGIEFRGFSQDTVEKLAKYSGVPVWNGLTDLDHPTQVLADLLTIKEQFGTIAGRKLVFIGDGRNNMANALMIGATKMGMDFVIAAPKTLFPSEELVNECNEFAKLTNATITITENLDEAVLHADVLYTDVWCSMGEEDKAKERIELLSPYQINQLVVDKTQNKKTIVMHCLPAIKGKEITEQVFENNATVIFDEAENRMHTIKAVMVATL
jgi:ornithine carbamoyltransferase